MATKPTTPNLLIVPTIQGLPARYTVIILSGKHGNNRHSFAIVKDLENDSMHIVAADSSLVAIDDILKADEKALSTDMGVGWGPTGDAITNIVKPLTAIPLKGAGALKAAATVTLDKVSSNLDSFTDLPASVQTQILRKEAAKLFSELNDEETKVLNSECAAVVKALNADDDAADDDAAE